MATGHAIEAVEAEADLASHLMHAQGGVALIDAAAATSPITSLTERLKAQFPDLVLVVAGGTEDQGALTPQITRGTVYRFLHKPLSEQRVKLFVAAAVAPPRRGALRDRRGGADAAGPDPAQATRRASPGGSSSLAALAGLGVFGWLKFQPAPTAAPAAARLPRQPPSLRLQGFRTSSAGTITRASRPGTPRRL